MLFFIATQDFSYLNEKTAKCCAMLTYVIIYNKKKQHAYNSNGKNNLLLSKTSCRNYFASGRTEENNMSDCTRNCDRNNNETTELAPLSSSPSCPHPRKCICECVSEIVRLNNNANCLLDTYVFKEGYETFEVNGMRGVIVNFGIHVKYTDCCGNINTTIEDGSVVFCNVPRNILNNIEIHICNPPKTTFCNGAVKVEFIVCICERDHRPGTRDND